MAYGTSTSKKSICLKLYMLSNIPELNSEECVTSEDSECCISLLFIVSVDYIHHMYS